MPEKRTKNVPYPPSWQDRFADWIDRLPLPSWLFYILLYAALIFVEQGLLWAGGYNVFPTVERGLLSALIWCVAQFAGFHFVKLSASIGVDRFRDALQMGNAEFQNFKYRFTVMPARTGWILTFLAAALIYLGSAGFRNYMGPAFFQSSNSWLGWILLLFMLSSGMAMALRVIQILIAASNLFSKVKKINLFDLGSLYGLSTITSRIGLLAVAFAVLTFISNLSFFSPGRGVAVNDSPFYYVVDTVGGLAAFIIPLLGLHRRLVAEKARVSKENNDRLNDAFWQLQRRVDKGQLTGISDLRSSVSALMEFRQEIKKLPTWPWETGTVRGFGTALLVPMSVWIVQQVLLRTVVR